MHVMPSWGKKKMRTYVAILLLGTFTAVLTIDKAKNAIVDEEYFPEECIVYKSDHDIVKLLLPLNSHKKPDNSTEPIGKAPIAPVFFVQADTSPDGKREYHGLYILKTDKPQKLLENGKDMAAPGDKNNLVYLAASDGIYTYDEIKGKADKYGNINDDIINIEKEAVGEVIYILTANKEVFKVTDNGNTKQKVEDIAGAEQIVIDYDNNIYFIKGKNLYAHTKDGVKEVTGLPENPSNLMFIRPTIKMSNGVLCLVDNQVFTIKQDGTGEMYHIEFKENNRPTALSMEAGLLQYFAKNKKIYEFNLITMVKGNQIEGINEYISDFKNEIEYATKIGN